MSIRLLCIIWMGILSSITHADIYISVPPLQSKLQLNKTFEPIVKALGEHLGEKVIFQSEDTWLGYARDLRADQYDILLSEAHILSFLMLSRNQGGFSHLPITHIPVQKQLHLVSKREKILSPKHLINKKICVKPSPTLDSVSLYNLYSNPISQPLIVEINGNYSEVKQAMINGKCAAAVLPASSEYLMNDSRNLTIVHNFTPIPNLGWTMSSRLSEENQIRIRNFFRHVENKENFGKILMLLTEAKEIQNTKPFNANIYKDHHKLLSKVWGW